MLSGCFSFFDEPSVFRLGHLGKALHRLSNTAWTTVIVFTAIAAAISAHSIEIPPDSSLKKALSERRIEVSGSFRDCGIKEAPPMRAGPYAAAVRSSGIRGEWQLKDICLQENPKHALRIRPAAVAESRPPAAVVGQMLGSK
jgi:hypothetical protein